jgi:ABC-type transport system involved in cytochrome c biogenesis permease subunit
MSDWLLLLYLVTFLSYVYNFFVDKKYLQNVERIFLFITLLFHAAYFVERTIFLGHLPIVTQYETFTLLAFSIGFTYFLLELLSDIKGTGSFILLFALAFQAKSTLFIQDNYVAKSVLENYPLATHVITAILGYTALSIAAAYAGMYLLLYKNIKTNKFSIVFERLPNLETLEQLNFYSIIIGFVLLTIAIILGFTWLPSAFENFDYSDPKIVSSLIVWLIYGTGIVMKVLKNVVGRNFAKYSLYGFVVSLLSLLLTNTMFNSFHDFVK